MALASKKKKIFDGRYEILSIVGRGKRSVVYHARHITGAPVEVALKILVKQKDSASLTDSLRKEALAMVSSRHKYVVRLDDFHSLGDLCYLSMEYAPGGDLRKYLTSRKELLGAKQCELFLIQSLEALSFIHQAGIIHRDLKPDNILVVSDTEIRIADFGVAVLPGEESTIEELERGVGTMSYMAPEVLKGEFYDKRSDIYALAVSFYEMASGTHPFENAPLAKQLEVREDKNIPHLKQIAPHIPDYVANAIMQALKYNPDERFQSARDFVQAILTNREQSNEDPLKAAPGKKPLAQTEKKPAARSDQAPQTKTSQKPEPKQAQKPRGALDAIKQVTAETRPTLKESESNKHEGREGTEQSKEPVTKETQKTAGAETNGTKKSASRLLKSIPSENEESLQPVASATRPGQGKTSDSQPEKTAAADQKKDALKTKPQKKIRLNAEKTEAAAIEQTAGPSPQQHTLAAKAGLNAEEIRKRSARLRASTESDPGLASPLATVSSREKAERVRRLKYSLTIAIIIATLVVIDFSTGHKISKAATQVAASVFSSSESSVDYLPKFNADGLTFPALQPGVYNGKIEGMLPGETASLTFISLPDAEQIITLIGADGFSPAYTPYSKVSPDSPLRLRINGFIIDLYGAVENDVLRGEFINRTTGDRGSWSAEPMKGS
ncbi:MAG: serine/threonine protein kinase [Candidatus Dadabacteria bacterium]|nr:MAG: serine/threonine protein kinase [Candidatus Dadabacteria bacterium]